MANANSEPVSSALLEAGIKSIYLGELKLYERPGGTVFLTLEGNSNRTTFQNGKD